ncbi:MAG: DUF4198 domain-containing protein [Gemmatimonadota bacterium]|nr:DUF4198 domain-containing protein [Gemmatimonadota bacterium]
MSAKTPRRLFTAGIGAACAILALAAVAAAHDFWLVPDAFQVVPGGQVEVRGQTSSRFPTSESAVAVDRVADARLVGAAGSERIEDLSHRGTSLLLRHRPTTPGQRIVAVALHPRSVRESAASFRRYLELEGAPEVLARVDREGLLRGRDSVTRRYAKYAKTAVEVGAGGPRAFARIVGHPLEFVPEHDPAALAVGDTLRVRLLYRGGALAGAKAHAGAVDWSTVRVVTAPAPASNAAATPDAHLESDNSGLLRVAITRPGLWNVRTIHVVPADSGSGADWDTHWATLVFRVADGGGRAAAPPEGTAPGAQSADSAAVVGVVERYHRALADGDSATALALLAPDAVILESGGFETRAEYRSHHLPGDIQFARAIRSDRGPVRVSIRGDIAWASSTSTTQGEFRGRAINSAGAELMVLSREPDGWKIRAIHWSSRSRRPAQ